MTLADWMSNLGAWSAQVALLVAAGSVLPWLLRLRAPGPLLVYRHTLLAACLSLPAIQPWTRPAAAGDVTVTTRTTAVLNAAPSVRPPVSLAAIAAAILAAGIVLRTAWLGAGLWNLRRWRRRAHLFTVVEGVEVLLSRDVSGPVTFGWRQPVVLLPERFASAGESARRAVLCHELLHVSRRDWPVTVIEEIIRTVLWFHPAIWWLLGQIQLTREQLVDRRAIAMLDSRDEYLEALLAAAGARPTADLAPAPLFLRRRHLSQRVALILQEVTMSRKRIAASLTAVVGALLFLARFGVVLFPLTAPAQEVSIERGGEKLLHRTVIDYPPEAIEQNIQGSVVVEVKLDQRGTVTDARVISGPEQLRRAALRSVLDWHYDTTGGATPVVQVAVDFKLPPGGAPRKRELRPAPLPPADSVLRAIDTRGLPSGVAEKLAQRLTLREGDAVTADTLGRLGQIAKEVDEHIVMQVRSSMRGDGRRETTVNFSLPQASPPPAAVLPSSAPDHIRVGGNAQSAKIVQQVIPVYPPLAKQARIQGTVRFNVLIAKDGTMKNVSVEAGHPLLVSAAEDAVKQWVYSPTYLNGEAVEVVTRVDVNFTLRDQPPPAQ